MGDKTNLKDRQDRKESWRSSWFQHIMTHCYAVWLGCVEYGHALELQMRVCGLKKQGMAEDILLLLEHPPVITVGRNGKWQNLLAADQVLQARGVQRFEVDRGGDITFHGPGQLVGYPLLKLEKGEQDVHRYMRNLEEVLIRVVASYGIDAGRNEKYTGVWTSRGKIAAMGVHLSRWVTRHGFALNVATDLSFYDLIVPCGIVGKQVASMEDFLGRKIGLEDVAGRVIDEFGPVFNREMKSLPRQPFMELLDKNRP